jgi:two-component system sensor histidine kinase DegS
MEYCLHTVFDREGSMMPPEFSADALDRIVSQTVELLDAAKEDIYEIAESARREMQALQQDLQLVETQLRELFAQEEHAQQLYTQARVRLAEVSRNFAHHSEEDIKKAYEEAYRLQTQVLLLQEREAQIRRRRDDLQRRVRNVDRTIVRANGLIESLSALILSMAGSLSDLGTTIKDMEQTRFLGTRIIEAQEEERKRVAREIHDGPAQAMANVVLRAELCERMLDRDLDKVREELRELKDTVRRSLAEVRQIIFDLRPMALDDLGLIPTLRRYLADFQEKTGIDGALVLVGEERRFSAAVELTVFRMVQEALTNVRKHAKASSCRVHMEVKEDIIRVCVEDNGRGFDPRELENQRGDQNFGILGMKERVNLLRGEISWHSTVGRGTRVVFSIPADPPGEGGK